MAQIENTANAQKGSRAMERSVTSDQKKGSGF